MGSGRAVRLLRGQSLDRIETGRAPGGKKAAQDPHRETHRERENHELQGRAHRERGDEGMEELGQTHPGQEPQHAARDREQGRLSR